MVCCGTRTDRENPAGGEGTSEEGRGQAEAPAAGNGVEEASVGRGARTTGEEGKNCLLFVKPLDSYSSFSFQFKNMEQSLEKLSDAQKHAEKYQREQADS